MNSYPSSTSLGYFWRMTVITIKTMLHKNEKKEEILLVVYI